MYVTALLLHLCTLHQLAFARYNYFEMESSDDNILGICLLCYLSSSLTHR